MVLKIKTIPLVERGDHVEFKYIIRNSFLLLKIPKEGSLNENLDGNDLKGIVWGKSAISELLQI